MLKIDIDEIARMLKQESERNGGTLSKLDNIAWHAYLSSLPGAVLDHVDYERVQQYFPNFDDDPDAQDPVLAMAIGKHYKDNYYGVAEGEFVNESEFEGLYRQIKQETKHFGGHLPPPYTVAWSGKLLGLHQCKALIDLEYELLLEMLPILEDNPVKKVEEFTRQYVEV